MSKKLKAGTETGASFAYRFNPAAAAGVYIRRKKVFSGLGLLALAGVFMVLFRHLVFSSLLAICIMLAIDEFLMGVKRKENDALHLQTISFISYMILMLKAKKTVRQIFKSYLGHAKKPLKVHLEIMVNQLQLSVPLNRALDNLYVRCESREIKLLASALKINDKIGGNLVFILENISRSLKHSLQAKSKVSTLTIQSRFSATIISLFPIAALTGLYFLMGDMVKDFLDSGFSNIVLTIGGLLEVAGIIAIKKVVGRSS
ncbi:MAG: type II secretion system F family protein [Actinomycetota bacterium]|nr:type II secretion system F family protein [Actinomycetota bacterium]